MNFLKILLICLLFLILYCEDSTGQNFYDRTWNKFSKNTGIGGHHEENFSDKLKILGICDSQTSGEDCFEVFLANLSLLNDQNQIDIQIKNSSSYSRITFTFKDQVVVLNASEISKIITVPFDPVGLYKIETSSGVVFENSSFNFRGSLKDGTIITTDGTLINDLDLAGCNLINVETGKIETVSGQCLTPTNP